MGGTWSEDTCRVGEPPQLPSTEERLRAGEVLEGGYRVTCRVGGGAMGVVYQGWDECLERPVAIKVMRTTRLSSSLWRKQFVAEARAMARVRHPNVVEVHRLGFIRDTPYIVMEYIDGRSLTAWLRGQPRLLQLDEALRIVGALCLGTQAIHDSGVVHGDLKPGNVLVDGARIAITDFGLAHPIDAELSPWEGDVAGTPAYLAPELAARIRVPAALVPRADVYALGVIAYELLTGARPFDADSTASLLDAQVKAVAPTASERRLDLPVAFDEVLRCALAKDPRERFHCPEAFRAALLRARRTVDCGTKVGSVLIVDDDDDTRDYTAYLLRRHAPRLAIHEASNGAIALEKIGDTSVDLVLADLQMPVMDGAMLVARLRADARTRHVPVVVVTGHGGASQWRALRTQGVDDFLVKPFDDAMLWSTVSRFIA